MLMHGVQNKIVEMEVEGTGASLIQLTAKACQLFQLDVVTMQAWDKDFEEWADLDDDQTVPTNTKIKVLSTPSLVTLDASCSSEASCVGWDYNERQGITKSLALLSFCSRLLN